MRGSPTANSTPGELAAAVVWQVSQAIAECLIMCTPFSILLGARLIVNTLYEVFLARVLLTSRSGLKKSDSIVNHLVRNVVQIGLFATIWAIAGLATYFLLPRRTIYTIFNATSGSIYTHVGDCPFTAECHIFTGTMTR